MPGTGMGERSRKDLPCVQLLSRADCVQAGTCIQEDSIWLRTVRRARENASTGASIECMGAGYVPPTALSSGDAATVGTAGRFRWSHPKRALSPGVSGWVPTHRREGAALHRYGIDGSGGRAERLTRRGKMPNFHTDPGCAPGRWRVGRTAIAPVLKTGVRKDFWVRIPGPPLDKKSACWSAAFVGPTVGPEASASVVAKPCERLNERGPGASPGPLPRYPAASARRIAASKSSCSMARSMRS
jgi:hypothetical protein